MSMNSVADKILETLIFIWKFYKEPENGGTPFICAFLFIKREVTFSTNIS